MPKPKWSEQQLAIFDAILDRSEHVLVTARAGCAKTTTAVEGANQCDGNESILMCAYNKDIAKELDRRVLGHVKVNTNHSLGYQTVRREWSKHFLDITKDDNIELEVIRSVVPRLAGPDAVQDVKGIVSMAKALMVEENDDLLKVMRKYDFEPLDDDGTRAEDYCKWTRKALAEFRVPRQHICYDDMVYLPAYFGMKTGNFNKVFVDEAQDLNRAQRILVQNALKKGGRIFPIGDDRQAIYVFRGADSQSLGSFREIFHPIELGLTTTYRCPKVVVAYANRYVPDLRAAPTAPEGVLRRVQEHDMKAKWRPGDFVIARTNVILVKLCMDAIRRGIPSKMLGRNVGASIIGLISKSKKDTIPELVSWLHSWGEREAARLARNNEDESVIQALYDRVETVIALAEARSTVDELMTFVSKLFVEATDKEYRPKLTFMTAHKAKGLENHRVWLIDSSFRPNKNQEEENLYYVAVTRSAGELYLVQQPKKVRPVFDSQDPDGD